MSVAERKDPSTTVFIRIARRNRMGGFTPNTWLDAEEDEIRLGGTYDWLLLGHVWAVFKKKGNRGETDGS